MARWRRGWLPAPAGWLAGQAASLIQDERKSIAFCKEGCDFLTKIMFLDERSGDLKEKYDFCKGGV